MNIEKLKQAEALFLQRYPNGFLHPDMQALGKKHKMDKMIELSQKSFKKSRFRDALAIAESMTKIISRSSMVSMFEKAKVSGHDSHSWRKRNEIPHEWAEEIFARRPTARFRRHGRHANHIQIGKVVAGNNSCPITITRMKRYLLSPPPLKA